MYNEIDKKSAAISNTATTTKKVQLNVTEAPYKKTHSADLSLFIRNDCSFLHAHLIFILNAQLSAFSFLLMNKLLEYYCIK